MDCEKNTTNIIKMADKKTKLKYVKKKISCCLKCEKKNEDIKETMLPYCVKCRNKTGNLDPNIFETKNGRITMQSKYAVCGIKNL